MSHELPPIEMTPRTRPASRRTTLIENNVQYRSAIFGPWYWFAICTGMMLPFRETPYKICSFLQYVSNVVSIVFLVVRQFYFLIIMIRVEALTLKWAYYTVVFFTSTHCIVSCVTLTNYRRGKFFEKLIGYMREATRDQMCHVPKLALISKLMVVVIMLGPPIVYVIQVWLTFHKTFDMLKNPIVWEIASKKIKFDFRLLLGLNIVDSILVLWGSIHSTAVLAIYLLGNAAVCREYRNFRKELKAHVADGTILELNVIKSFQTQLIDFLRTARFLNNMNDGLLNVSFISGIMCQVATQYALHSFSDELTGIEIAMYSVILVQSIALLVYSMRRPALLQNELTKTTHLLLLDHGIWEKTDNVLVKRIAKNITARLESVEYIAKGISSTKASNFVFIAVLIVIPFFVDILGGYKPINSTTTQG